MKSSPKVRKIAFVGGHLPRKCGIATFTTGLLGAVQSAHPQRRCLAVPVNDNPGSSGFCLQRESGIHGGHASGHILALLDELKMPVVTTLHTELRDPRAVQQRVIEGLINGLHLSRVNGSNSTDSPLAFLLSLAEMELAHNTLPGFRGRQPSRSNHRSQCP